MNTILVHVITLAYVVNIKITFIQSKAPLGLICHSEFSVLHKPAWGNLEK